MAVVASSASRILSLTIRSLLLEFCFPCSQSIAFLSTDGCGASDLTSNPAKQLPRSASPFHVNPSPYYFHNPYYYGGYDGLGNDWNDYSRSVTPDGVEMQHGMFHDNDAAMFSQGYGYLPFGSYMPPPDSHLQGTQQYHSSDNTLHSYSHVGSLPTEIQAKATCDKVPLGVGTATGGNAGGLGGRTTYSPSSYQDLWPGYGGFQSFPWLDAPVLSNGPSKHGSGGGFSSGLNSQSTRPTSAFGKGTGYMMYPPNGMYGPYGSVGYNSWTNGHGWMVVDNKYKSKCRGYGNENIDGLSELNRGPRAKSFKNHKEIATGTEAAVEGQNIPATETNKEEKFEQYNREDFKEDYTEARFFVIKSYSEDDVHKSIKYGVWTSTLNGNKKLDAAYQEAQANPGGGPIFLLFSVNTSGQFVGLAEMIGRVDFDKTVEHWQQEKWKGCFPVKWHIVKDIPNSSLRHITLENNENKPVTNSRDTQEVDSEKGIQILKNFKSYVVKTSILDDFGFYAARERVMQERRARQRTQRQVSEGKPGVNVIPDGAALKHPEKDGSNGVIGVAGVDVKSVVDSHETKATAANLVAGGC
ncbi:unnamed protein product [Linum tenue]|uniref:YTH domain-containing family protein n=1 Tax=Linum tenue TaxID=586396 RepID=A0AAV0LER3_9ROSI|nr:unnamed protein product [Linum tenue]